MSPSTPSLESEIVQWLVDLIESEDLLDSIGKRDDIESIVESLEQEANIPTFGFDHLSRKANARAAATVLEHLSPLEIVAVDKSISLVTGEILRPDILCFNPESRTLVVFEVKRDKLSERQAVTELAGYEQELRNALPFLGDFDINFVVLSTQWDTLLDHAVANFNAWSSKYCLALMVNADERPFSATCRLPEAWRLRGVVGMPEDALQTIDVYLEDIGDRDEGEDFLPRTLLTATSAIARAGDRRGSHGFAMLWRDHSGFGAGKWAWTLCGIDPIAIHAWCRASGLEIRESKLTKYMDKQADEAPRQVPTAVYKIAKEAFPLLRGRYSPNFEGECSWSEKLLAIRHRAEPVTFEFWGALGDHAREFVSNAGVRDRYMSYIDQNEMDWSDPSVALPLLANICGEIPFPDGLVRCSDAFQAGVKLGLYEVLSMASAASEDQERDLHSLLQWSFTEALHVAVEMAEIYRTTQEIDVPPPALSNSPSRRASAACELSSWTINHLIGEDHPFHQVCFQVGHSGALYFSDWLDPEERNAFVQARSTQLVSIIREPLSALIKKAIEQGFDMSRGTSLRRYVGDRTVSPKDPDACASAIMCAPPMTILEVLQNDEARSFDDVVPPVFHTVGPMPILSVDWEGLKDSVRMIFESGRRHPVVIVSQNGRFGTGHLDEFHSKLLKPIEDPSVEVFFQDLKAAASFVARMTWSELQANFEMST